MGAEAVMTCPSGAVQVSARCVGGWLLVLDPFLEFGNWPCAQRSPDGHQVTLLAPIRIGDTIRMQEEVTEVRPSKSKPDRGTVTTRVQRRNQEGVVCHEGLWTMLFTRRTSGPGSASQGV
ncbi:hypothetical protein ACIA5G_25480 [Amycolatopsis sp. NPDC051758]|uniref:hypothetical protein n=1 Tax=Amycolatopsis sp. NPDC051758 TaxID=3363935 RepID=UPI0037B7AF1B